MSSIEQAIQLIEEDKLQEAVDLLRQSLEQADDNETLMIADLFIDLGLLEDARPILETLLEKYPDEAEIRVVLAEIYIDLEEDEQIGRAAWRVGEVVIG